MAAKTINKLTGVYETTNPCRYAHFSSASFR